MEIHILVRLHVYIEAGPIWFIGFYPARILSKYPNFAKFSTSYEYRYNDPSLIIAKDADADIFGKPHFDSRRIKIEFDREKIGIVLKPS